MTIKGRQFRRITGRQLDGPRRKTGIRSQLRDFQGGLRPIRERKMGSATKTTTSTHMMYVVDYTGGAYGYVRA